jgi:hypothetical protein
MVMVAVKKLFLSFRKSPAGNERIRRHAFFFRRSIGGEEAEQLPNELKSIRSGQARRRR